MSNTTHITVQGRDLTPAIDLIGAKHAVLQLQVEIDGEVKPAVWGGNEFLITPGTHEVKVYCLHSLYGKRLTRTTTVHVESDTPCDLEYVIQSAKKSGAEAVLKVNGEPDSSGIEIRTESEIRRGLFTYYALAAAGSVAGMIWYLEITSIWVNAGILIGLVLFFGIFIMRQRSIET